MRFSSLIFIMILLLACTKKVSITENKGRITLHDLTTSISNLEEVEWKVGKKRESLVSKGISFKVDVPELERKAIKELDQKFQIDHWLYQVSHINRGMKRVLGYFKYQSSNVSSINNKVNVNIFYHAAAVSNDFRLFHCPAFNHRLKINSLREVSTGQRAITNIIVSKGEYINNKIDEVGFSPLIYSAGTKLEGDIIVEIALYSSKDKRIYSNWHALNNLVRVEQELQVNVASCQGVKEENMPLKKTRTMRIEDLQIKK